MALRCVVRSSVIVKLLCAGRSLRDTRTPSGGAPVGRKRSFVPDQREHPRGLHDPDQCRSHEVTAPRAVGLSGRTRFRDLQSPRKSALRGRRSLRDAYTPSGGAPVGRRRSLVPANGTAHLSCQSRTAYRTFSGGCFASGKLTASNPARVGAIWRMSITPRSRPAAIPYPWIRKAERMAGREGR